MSRGDHAAYDIDSIELARMPPGKLPFILATQLSAGKRTHLSTKTSTRVAGVGLSAAKETPEPGCPCDQRFPSSHSVVSLVPRSNHGHPVGSSVSPQCSANQPSQHKTIKPMPAEHSLFWLGKIVVATPQAKPKADSVPWPRGAVAGGVDAPPWANVSLKQGGISNPTR